MQGRENRKKILKSKWNKEIERNSRNEKTRKGFHFDNNKKDITAKQKELYFDVLFVCSFNTILFVEP